MRILIAEDDTASRLILEAALAGLGHEVVAATESEQAWQMFQSEKVEAIISDAGLGYGFCDPYYDDDYSDGYGYGYPYASSDSDADNGSCYVVRRRVHTTHGWRRRPVQVCG